MDITKTGYSSYKDLQKENNKSFDSSGLSEDALKYYQDTMSRYNSITTHDPYNQGTKLVESSLANSPTPWGESMFDEDTANEEDFSRLGDIRAENQPWYSQLASGITKGVANAGTVFIDGTLGLVYGLGTGIVKGIQSGSVEEGFKKGINALFNNDISNTLNQVNKELENILPNYRTQEEQENPWYKNLGTMNFWADSFLKNLGFTVGAFYSGSAWTKGLKALKLLNNGISSGIVGSVLSGVNEGRIEANHTMNDLKELTTRQIEDEYINARNAIIFSGDDVYTKKQKLIELESNKEGLLAQAEENANKAGASTLLWNSILLPLNNYYMYGRLYARGFKNAKNLSEGKLTSATREAEELMAKESNDLLKNTAIKDGRLVWNDISKKKAVAKGLGSALLEGNEEMYQQMISTASGEMYTPDSPDAYYKAMIDGKSEVETKDFLTALAKGFAGSYGDSSQWEQFAVGALTGLLGIPTFGRAQNSDSNTYLGKGKRVGLSGGLIGELKHTADINRRGREAVDIVNKFEDSVLDNKTRFAQSKFFTDTMNGFARENNKWEYLNHEDNDMATAFARYIALGQEDRFREIVNQSFENISDEELDKIAKYTDPNNTESGNNGWKNVDGTYMSETPEGREEMKKKLAEKRDDILEQLDDYKDSILTVQALSNGRLSSDKEEELAWLHWKPKRFKNRYKKLINDRRENITSVAAGLREWKTALEEERKNLTESDYREETDDEGNVTKINLLKENESMIKGIGSQLDFLDSLLQGANVFMVAAQAEANKEVLDEMASENYYKNYNRYNGLNYTDYKQTIEEIQDLSKLSLAAKTFDEKFKEYIENPIKLEENRKKLDKEETIKRESEVDERIKKFVNDSNVSDLVEGDNSGEFSIDDAIDRFEKMGFNIDSIEEDIENIPDENPNVEDNSEDVNKEALKKLKKAKNIQDTEKRLNREVDRAEDIDDITANDIKELLALNKKGAESVEDFLDIESEVFNNPDLINVTPDEVEDLESKTPEEIKESIETIKQIRLDNAKAAVRTLSYKMQEDDKTLSKMPKESPKETPKNNKTVGHDAVDKLEAVNKLANAKSKVKREDEDILTPQLTVDDINSYIDNDNKTSRDTNGTKGYWKTNTTQYQTHRERGDNRPYHEVTNNKENQQLYSITHNFLNRNNTFERQNNNSVQEGQPVYFGFSIKLQQEIKEKTGKNIPVLLILNENGEVIGDLITKADSTLYNSYIDLDTTYKNAATQFTKDFDNFKTKNEDIYIIPNMSSTVAKMYVGRPQYTPINEMNTLNAINVKTKADGSIEPVKFLLGIAMNSGANAKILIEPGRRKSEGSSAREDATLSPLDAKAGQPFFLMETSSPQKHYYPVPIVMPTFNSQLVNSQLGKEISSKIESLLNSNNSEDDILKWKDGIKELLVAEDFFVEEKQTMTPEGPIKTLSIKVKKSPSDDNWINIYSGVKSPDALNTIINGLGAANLSFQISRKYINGTYKGMDYNRMIGELAMTNLPIGATHTINDFYTINPIINGKETKAKRIKGTNSKDSSYVPDVKTEDKTTDKSFVEDLKNNQGNNETIKDEKKGIEGSSNVLNQSANNKDILIEKLEIPKFPSTGILNEEDRKKVLDFTNKLKIYSSDDIVLVSKDGTIIKIQENNESNKEGKVGLYLNTMIPLGVFRNYSITNNPYHNPISGIKIINDNTIECDWSITLTNRDVPYTRVKITVVGDIVKDYIKAIEYRTKDVTEYRKTGFIDINEATRASNARVSVIVKNISTLIKDTVNDNVGKEVGETSQPLSTPSNSPSSQPSTESPTKPSRKENIQTIKGFGFVGTKDRLDLLDKLDDENIELLANTKKIKASQKFEKFYPRIKPNMTNAEINEIFKTVMNTKGLNREASEDYKVWNPKKELRVLDRILPQLSREERIHIQDKLIDIANTNKKAWGQFKNGIITIAEQAARGTLYHEAFHYVFNTLMTPTEVNTAMDLAKAKYGDLSQLGLEEKLAEDFRRYMQYEDSFITGNLVKLWRKLKHMINRIKGKEISLDKLFYDISRGKYGKISDINLFNINNVDTNLVDIEEHYKPWKKDANKINKTVRVYLKNQHEKGYFELVKDNEETYYSVHFKTKNEKGQGSEEAKPSTKEERAILYKQLDNLIPYGAKISTWGELSEGGVYALNKVGKNMIKIGERTVALKETLVPINIPIFEKIDTNSNINTNIIKQYHNNSLMYDNLNSEQIEYLKNRGISIEEYNKLTIGEKEILFECM